MNSTHHKIRTALKADFSTAIDHANGAELARLIGALDGSNEDFPFLPESADASAPRFSRLNSDGYPAGPNQAYAAVLDATTGLIWTRSVLACGAVPWKEALAQASKVDLFGKSDWRAPTVRERISLIEFDRHAPALNTDYFDAGGEGWEWTSTPDSEFPSGYAWFVSLRYGGVDGANRARHDRVRAVRSSHQLGLGL